MCTLVHSILPGLLLSSQGERRDGCQATYNESCKLPAKVSTDDNSVLPNCKISQLWSVSMKKAKVKA